MSVTSKLSLDELNKLSWAIEEMVGYLTDNSCSDPECCGGPYYTEQDFKEAESLLKRYNLEWDGTYECQ